MKLCRPKGKFSYEWIPGPFSSSTYQPQDEQQPEAEFPEGCFLLIKDGKAEYLSKEAFEAGYEPTKVKKASTGSTQAQGSKKGGSSKKKEVVEAAKA